MELIVIVGTFCLSGIAYVSGLREVKETAMELIKERHRAVVSRANIGEERHTLKRNVEDVTRMIQHFLAEYYHLFNTPMIVNRSTSVLAIF